MSGFLILHVSFLDEQMTEFLRSKQRLVEFEANIRPARVIDIDKFKEKLNFLSQEATTLFLICPQKAANANITIETYVAEITGKVRAIRNLIYHFVGLETEPAREAKHEALAESEHLLELQY